MLPYVVVRNLYDRWLGLDTVDRNNEFQKVLDDVMKAWVPGCGGSGGDVRTGVGPSRPLVTYVGTYEHPAFGPISVAWQANELGGTFAGHDFVLRHLDAEMFAVEGSALSGRTLRFHLADDGVIQSLSVSLEPAVADIVFLRSGHP